MSNRITTIDENEFGLWRGEKLEKQIRIHVSERCRNFFVVLFYFNILEDIINKNNLPKQRWPNQKFGDFKSRYQKKALHQEGVGEKNGSKSIKMGTAGLDTLTKDFVETHAAHTTNIGLNRACLDDLTEFVVIEHEDGYYIGDNVLSVQPNNSPFKDLHGKPVSDIDDYYYDNKIAVNAATYVFNKLVKSLGRTNLLPQEINQGLDAKLDATHKELVDEYFKKPLTLDMLMNYFELAEKKLGYNISKGKGKYVACGVQLLKDCQNEYVNETISEKIKAYEEHDDYKQSVRNDIVNKILQEHKGLIEHYYKCNVPSIKNYLDKDVYPKAITKCALIDERFTNEGSVDGNGWGY